MLKLGDISAILDILLVIGSFKYLFKNDIILSETFV